MGSDTSNKLAIMGGPLIFITWTPQCFENGGAAVWPSNSGVRGHVNEVALRQARLILRLTIIRWYMQEDTQANSAYLHGTGN